MPPAQVGFRKGTGPLLSRLASRSQLELVLCTVAITLALLLGITVVALAVQYSRGRRPPCWGTDGIAPRGDSRSLGAVPTPRSSPTPCLSFPPGMPFPADPSHTMCLTDACVRVASKILEALDTDTDPCQDFYQYSCGGWIKRNPLPNGRSKWSTFNSIWDQNQAIMKHLLGGHGGNGDSLRVPAEGVWAEL